MKTSTTEVQFRIDIEFEDCDVDVVYDELRSQGIITPVPSILVDIGVKEKSKSATKHKTPKEASVDFALKWLAGFVDRNEMCTQDRKWDKDYSKSITKTLSDGTKYSTSPDFYTELEEIGISVDSWYSLMMGCCHLVCTVSLEKFSTQLLKDANKIVFKIMKRFVKYYKQ